MSRAVGKDIGAPKIARVRLPAMWKEMVPTNSAPTITKAIDGSQLPNRSRKPSTLAVLLQIFLLSAAISMNTTSVNISLQSVVKKPILLGYSLSIMYLFYYVGTFVGPPITTKLMELFNWTASIWILALVSVLGAGSLFYYICTHERKNGGINNV